MVVLILMYSSFAQQKGADSLSAIREFSKLGQLYKRLPVQLDIHIYNTAVPVTAAEDTMHADMAVYFGKQDFYMQSEGLEEVANDSLVVMVNNPAKQIVVYANTQPLAKNIEHSVAMFMPDSTVEALSKKYYSTVTETGKNSRLISLKTRELVYGTVFPKETISISYNPANYETAEYIKTKVRLLPADSAVYAGFIKNNQYSGRLVSSKTATGTLYFLVKEVTTTYHFKKIRYDVLASPAREQDRVTKKGDGSFVPSKGFEEFIVSKRF
jgi:hypothetical protein